MSIISDLKSTHNIALEKCCVANSVDFASVQRLLEAEKTKKLLKRVALIQQNIDNEISQ